MSVGFAKLVRKVSEGAEPVIVPRRSWTRVARITAADLEATRDPGPTTLDAELYSNLPSLPANIKSRWKRIGPSPDDVTKRTGLVIGTSLDWAGIVPASVEKLSLDELPFDLELWHDLPSGQSMSLHTVIVCAYAPALYLAERMLR